MGSLFRRSFGVISRALKLQPEKHFVGKDFEGNSFYEIPAQRYFLGLLQQAKAKRIVIPPSGEQATRTAYQYTHEWNSWLQHKRDNPPTFSEIESNIMRRNLMAHRVESLETPKPKPSVQAKPVESAEPQTVESWTDKK